MGNPITPADATILVAHANLLLKQHGFDKEGNEIKPLEKTDNEEKKE